MQTTIKKLVGFLLLFSSILFFSCRSIVVRNYEAESKNDGKLRIVQISDFHSNDFGKDESVLIEKVASAQPDIILLTGDIFDFEREGNLPVKNVAILLEGISKIAPFYYVAGNHEYMVGHVDECSTLIEDFGGHFLKDTSVSIDFASGSLVIGGLYDPYEDLTEVQRLSDSKDNREAYLTRLKSVAEKSDEIKKDLENSGKTVLASVLLAHRPEYLKEYSKYDFDLVFSGHAHGGQWRIPGILNGLYAPHQGLFPRYAGGRKEKNDTVFIISRGLSYQCPNFPRIFNNPELVIVDLN